MRTRGQLPGAEPLARLALHALITVALLIVLVLIISFLLKAPKHADAKHEFENLMNTLTLADEADRSTLIFIPQQYAIMAFSDADPFGALLVAHDRPVPRPTQCTGTCLCLFFIDKEGTHAYFDNLQTVLCKKVNAQDTFLLNNQKYYRILLMNPGDFDPAANDGSLLLSPTKQGAIAFHFSRRGENLVFSPTAVPDPLPSGTGVKAPTVKPFETCTKVFSPSDNMLKTEKGELGYYCAGVESPCWYETVYNGQLQFIVSCTSYSAPQQNPPEKAGWCKQTMNLPEAPQDMRRCGTEDVPTPPEQTPINYAAETCTEIRDDKAKILGTQPGDDGRYCVGVYPPCWMNGIAAGVPGIIACTVYYKPENPPESRGTCLMEIGLTNPPPGMSRC